jgi:hypothetical protein
MKRILNIVFALLLTPLAAFAQTPTPTATPTFNPYVVGLAGFNLEASSESPRHALGIPYWGKEGIYLYGKATETIVAGSWVLVDLANQFTLADTSEALGLGKPTRVCVTSANSSTSSPYVWAWCGGGTFSAILTNSLTANTYLTTTTSGGVAGSTGVALAECVNIQAGVTDTRVKVKCPREIIAYFTPPTPAPTPTP